MNLEDTEKDIEAVLPTARLPRKRNRKPKDARSEEAKKGLVQWPLPPPPPEGASSSVAPLMAPVSVSKPAAPAANRPIEHPKDEEVMEVERPNEQRTRVRH